MDGAPDLIITDTSLLADGTFQPRTGALAVKGGRIVALGTPAELRSLADATTDVRSMPGRLVVPGFQDAHVHPAFGGRNQLRVHLDHLGTVEDYLETIAAYALDNPGEPWITGGGWAMYLFPGGAPRKEYLDRIVADRPVFLMNRDVHGAWVNSRALELAGVTSDTPDPWDGRIERDAMTGEPTGTLHEGAAYSFRDRFVPRTEPAEWRRALLVAQEYLHSLGIDRMARRVGDAGHPRGVRRPRRGRRADHAGLGEPVVGPASDPGADRRTGRARSRGDERQRPRHDREDHDRRRGRELLLRVAPALRRPGRVCPGAPRPVVHRRRGPAVRGDGARRAGSPGAHACDRRSCNARRAGRDRSSACGERPSRQPASCGAPSVRASRRRAALRLAGRGREHAAAVGVHGPADGGVDVATRGEGADRVAVPVRRSGPHGRDARRRERLAGVHAQPVARDGGRRHAGGSR